MKIINQGMELVPVQALHPHLDNPREGDLGAIGQSIEHNGFYGAVIVQRGTNTILAGAHRWKAAGQAGAKEIPVIYVDADDDQARRILLADNRANDLATQNSAKLAALLQDMGDLAGTLYDGDALDALLADLDTPLSPAAEPQDPEGRDTVPEPPAQPRTQPGDLLLLGAHRLVCGDCRDPAVLERLLGGQGVQVVFTSPPYAQQRSYDTHTDFKPIPAEEYVTWYAAVAANLATVLAPDGSYFLNIKEHTEEGQRSLYVKDLVVTHVRAWGWRFVDELCWVKRALPGDYVGRFKNGWEPIFHFTRREGHKHFPDAVATPSENTWHYTPQTNFSLQRDGLHEGEKRQFGAGLARPSNVLQIQGSPDVGNKHPAAFPVALPTFLLRAYSEPGDAVLDPFCGSGSVILAAQREGRVGYGVELSPAYTDVIAQRYTELTGQEAEWQRA